MTDFFFSYDSGKPGLSYPAFENFLIRYQAATSNSYRYGNAMTLPQILSTPICGIKLSRDRLTLLINSLSPTLQLVMGSGKDKVVLMRKMPQFPSVKTLSCHGRQYI